LSLKKKVDAEKQKQLKQLSAEQQVLVHLILYFFFKYICLTEGLKRKKKRPQSH
jgi:hypothetical protein